MAVYGTLKEVIYVDCKIVFTCRELSYLCRVKILLCFIWNKVEVLAAFHNKVRDVALCNLPPS
jgi:hypothetical protein